MYYKSDLNVASFSFGAPVSYFSVAAVCSPTQHPKTRSGGPIYIIQNTSFSCEQLPMEYKDYAFMPLTDDDKMSLLVSKGGGFMTSLMAIDKEHAERNFKNLLITSGLIQVSEVHLIAV